MLERVSIQDFIIAKAVKLGTYTNLPPGAVVSIKRMAHDRRSEPQYGDRVPYLVIHRGLNNRLIDSVVSPEEFLRDKTLQLHGTYYITKQIIPALERVFNLIGVDIMAWYNEMPKVQRAIEFTDSQIKQSKIRTIDQYYAVKHCVCCKKETQNGMSQS